MISLLFVGDGPRDTASMPCLVRTILNVEVDAHARQWARLHKLAGAGYGRKLKFAVRTGRGLQAVGVVATVDADRDRRGRRLDKLQIARTEDRSRGTHFPTTLGEARPHGEAWLLDDRDAVRIGLQLAADAKIPTIRQTRSPKAALEQLLGEGPLASSKPLDAWARIAQQVDLRRCAHAEETGFAAFAKDVGDELGPLVK